MFDGESTGYRDLLEGFPGLPDGHPTGKSSPG